MDEIDLRENVEEQLNDAVNVLHLLMSELEADEEDQHYLRSVGIVEKMIKTAIADIQNMEGK